MEEHEREYPGYGFAQHKGYGTSEHQNAIRELGPCPIHRLSFPFIRELCGEFSELFYAFKQQLQDVDSATTLSSFEKNLKERWVELDDKEQRKIRLMLSRRWKNYLALSPRFRLFWQTINTFGKNSRTAADAFTSRHYHVRVWEDRVKAEGVAGEDVPEITE